MIRKITREELPLSLEVIHKSFETEAIVFGLTPINCPGHTSFMPLEKLENHFNWGFEMFGLFDGNNEMIGFFSLSKKEGNIYEIKNLGVLPQHRRKGYGKQMLDFSKQKVCEWNGEKLSVGIIDESAILKNWYIDNGFIHTSTCRFPHLLFTVGYMEWKNNNYT